MTWETADTSAPRRPRRGPVIAVVVVAVVLLAAIAALALDLRTRAVTEQTQRASHDGLVAASSVWTPLWQELEKATGDRDLAAIEGGAAVGVPGPGGTSVTTQVVVNEPTVISVIMTIESDGITTYVTQAVRSNAATGALDSRASGCDAGQMFDGRACLDLVEAQARQWSTAPAGG